MKKMVSTLIIGVALMGFSSPSLADSEDVTVKKIKTVEIIGGEEVLVEGEEISSYETSENEFSIFSTAGNRTASIVAKKPVFSKFYATATSKADYQQDTIGARVRAFNGSGTQLAQDSKSESKTTQTSATAYPGSVGPSGYAIGNHTFKRSGYTDWYPETRTNF
ncbi:hypothetical protein [Halalkalibacter alkalisediminis]|uniref:Uncharacterized protein n=1 Tax=Halalkalibacter alkalisediminis TaxID=935616 RepID=A0ABV6NJJ0_9BACI|nr:hypothetical protein [Halalkalibacter alkalisediminis]